MDEKKIIQQVEDLLFEARSLIKNNLPYESDERIEEKCGERLEDIVRDAHKRVLKIVAAYDILPRSVSKQLYRHFNDEKTVQRIEENWSKEKERYLGQMIIHHDPEEFQEFNN